jgi:uncharacterized protein YndB with AHSA1/START domain
MNTLTYSIEISAPKEKVWHTMLDLETYEIWSKAFQAGSTYDGSWDKGCTILFVSKEDNKQSGISGIIVENIPYEYVSVEINGELIDGIVDTSSDDSKKWVGAHESYRFTENNGITTINIELTSQEYDEEIKQMFDGMWPKALDNLKELAEAA